VLERRLAQKPFTDLRRPSRARAQRFALLAGSYLAIRSPVKAYHDPKALDVKKRKMP